MKNGGNKFWSFEQHHWVLMVLRKFRTLPNGCLGSRSTAVTFVPSHWWRSWERPWPLGHPLANLHLFLEILFWWENHEANHGTFLENWTDWWYYACWNHRTSLADWWFDFFKTNGPGRSISPLGHVNQQCGADSQAPSSSLCPTATRGKVRGTIGSLVRWNRKDLETWGRYG